MPREEHGRLLVADQVEARNCLGLRREGNQTMVSLLHLILLSYLKLKLVPSPAVVRNWIGQKIFFSCLWVKRHAHILTSKKNMVFESITFLKFKTEIVRKFVKNKQEIISNPKVLFFARTALWSILETWKECKKCFFVTLKTIQSNMSQSNIFSPHYFTLWFLWRKIF